MPRDVSVLNTYLGKFDDLTPYKFDGLTPYEFEEMTLF